MEVEMLMPAHYRTAHHLQRSHFSSHPESRSMSRRKALVALDRCGQKLIMDISLTPIASQGRPCVLVGLYDACGRRRTEEVLRGCEVRLARMMNDMVEHRTEERRLRQRRGDTDTLLSQQVALQTVTAIAHELNQPMAAVSAYSEVALHEAAGLVVPEKLRHALHACVEQAQLAGQALNLLHEFMHKGYVLKEQMGINELVQVAMAAA
jgi:signal transduction histidine kinase